MSKKPRQNKKSLDNFLDYIHNRMGPEERNAFEKQLQKDPFAQDAAEGLDMLGEKKIKTVVHGLNQRIIQKNRNKGSIVIKGIAAALILLVITGITFFAVEQVRKSQLESQISQEISHEKPDTMVSPPMATPSETPPETIGVYPSPPKKPIIKPVEEVVVNPEELETMVLDESDFFVAEYDVVAETLPTLARDVSTVSENRQMLVIPHIREIADRPDARFLRGTIIDITNGDALPGVSVVIKGTNVGVVTDMNGQFEIKLPAGEEVKLVASYIGMVMEEFSSENFNNDILAMTPDLSQLDEIVIIGYSTRRMGVPEAATGDYRSRRDYSPPVPTGGYPAFRRYLGEHSILPDTSQVRRAVVVLNFDIGINGQPKNLNVLRSPGEEFTQLTIELIHKGPAWTPAKIGDQKIEESVRIRIVFKR